MFDREAWPKQDDAEDFSQAHNQICNRITDEEKNQGAVMTRNPLLVFIN